MENFRTHLLPIKIWSLIVSKYLSYKRTTVDLPLPLAFQRNKLISITSEMIADLIQDSVVAIGETKLGILCLEIGTHSNRSGASMAMNLAGVPIFSIMLIRQWSRMAFLKYNQKQVQEFSYGISSRIIKIQSFKHIQNPTSTNLMESIVDDSFALMMG
jgi:hypothetical protein